MIYPENRFTLFRIMLYAARAALFSASTFRANSQRK
jgi:hypothetical protein